ncbi:MAG: hypothetical protein A3F72_07325 [Bacteroidetes bacterium RIFCSPLOWO2_12_FULL_35_15]|nr:MAG: hypothetical protein A3F72_07325 [Bacteroidetes bacterium RIFCSPLOWO2_12_FULL_35_15]
MAKIFFIRRFQTIGYGWNLSLPPYCWKPVNLHSFFSLKRKEAILLRRTRTNDRSTQATRHRVCSIPTRSFGIKSLHKIKFYELQLAFVGVISPTNFIVIFFKRLYL